MRFKTELKNIRTFNKLIAALNSLEKIAWVRLDDETARFTVIPETGSQVWASLSMDFLFNDYQIQSAVASNTINLELPLNPLQRALKSAINSDYATLRLTKKDGIPVLSMTIHTTPEQRANEPKSGIPFHNRPTQPDPDDPFADTDMEALELTMRREREKIITQDIPVRVLHPDTVETIMQPKVREPDVHIQLPPLMQLKAISDRFTKLAATTTTTATGRERVGNAPKLELSANMHGGLRLRIATEALDIESVWRGLDNPELDEAAIPGGIAAHPSTRFKEAGPDKWATVRVDGKDWSKVLSVGRLDGRVIACFADDHALILYAYVTQFDDATADDAVITYYVSSYSA
ncbi:Checkpoint protein hus1 [Gnomoniopsis sp. IMI 355080]|nr:Checkpoint protein hus1 [Gnomoniopsis sp. IMI 355080]